MPFLKFPLGSLQKKNTRDLAMKYNIPVANKPESQDICFIPDGNYRKFLKKYSGFGKRGNIVDDKGNKLATHDGIENYTVGQRKQLKIAIGKPLYVIKIIKETNTVVIGDKDKLKYETFNISDFNWLGNGSLSKKHSLKKVLIKVRARHIPVKGEVTINNKEKATVKLYQPVLGVAKGQGCVVYSQDGQLLGGGWIQ